MSHDNVTPFTRTTIAITTDPAAEARLELVAAETVNAALADALNRIGTEAALLHPTGSSATTLKIYLRAVRSRLEWMQAGGADSRA
jgi:hypothetical protein